MCRSTTLTPPISISSAAPPFTSCSTPQRPAWGEKRWRPGCSLRPTRRPPPPGREQRPTGRRVSTSARRSRCGDAPRPATSRPRAVPRLGRRAGRAGRAEMAALGGLGRSPRPRRAGRGRSRRGHRPAALDRAAGRQSRGRRHRRAAGVRHHRRGAAGHRAIAAYAGQLDLLATADVAAPALRELQARLGQGEHSAPVMLRRLGRTAAMAIPPSSVLYVPIQALTSGTSISSPRWSGGNARGGTTPGSGWRCLARLKR